MDSILLKGLSPGFKKRLQARAARNRRSMMQEAILILENEVCEIPPMQDFEPLKPLKPISNADVLRAIRAGHK